MSSSLGHTRAVTVTRPTSSPRITKGTSFKELGLPPGPRSSVGITARPIIPPPLCSSSTIAAPWEMALDEQ